MKVMLPEYYVNVKDAIAKIEISTRSDFSYTMTIKKSAHKALFLIEIS
jgi:hypothetical protein